MGMTETDSNGGGAPALPPWPFPAGTGLDTGAGPAPHVRPPAIMGVVNVTPDSFSDGGRFFDADRAVEHGLRLVGDGADILDVGGESTRPGAAPVAEDEELRRVLPVIERLVRETRAPISIDTMKAAVARAAVEAGATIVNDVSAGLADPQMLGTVAELCRRRPVHLVLMHRQGDPATMQVAPHYDDAVAEVREHLIERVAAAERAGVPRELLAIDPGIGFGKRLPHNLALLAGLPELRRLGSPLGLPLVLGVSRKSFIADLSRSHGPADWLAEERLEHHSSGPSGRIGGTAAAVALAVASGAVDVLRVHDVAIMKEVALVARALRQ